jgi:hypothetical protein
MSIDPPYEQEETALAAAEAAAIGGHAGDEQLDPAERPVKQAGGGEAEGFEDTEAALIENTSHGDQRPAHTILRHRGPGEEANARRADAEADRERSSEVGDQG